MARLLSVLLWTTVLLLLLAGIDQLLLRVPARHPAHLAVATFYRDLRTRAIDLVRGRAPAPDPAPAPSAKAPPPAGNRPAQEPSSIEGVIDHRQAPPSPAPRPAAGVTPPTESRPRYVYADSQGELHFAATLDEVPPAYREKARVLGE